MYQDLTVGKRTKCLVGLGTHFNYERVQCYYENIESVYTLSCFDYALMHRWLCQFVAECCQNLPNHVGVYATACLAEVEIMFI